MSAISTNAINNCKVTPAPAAHCSVGVTVLDALPIQSTVENLRDPFKCSKDFNLQVALQVGSAVLLYTTQSVHTITCGLKLI